jgi:hypothetical protein
MTGAFFNGQCLYLRSLVRIRRSIGRTQIGSTMTKWYTDSKYEPKRHGTPS